MATPENPNPAERPEPVESYKQKRSRLGTGGDRRNLMIYENAIRDGGGISYGGRDITRRYTPEETHEFYKSQQDDAGDDS